MLRAEVMKADYVQADETTTPVMNKDTHRAAKEYLWMVRAVIQRLVLFHYDQGSRAGAVIESLANRHNFKGYLQCDGFAGYETAFKTNPDVLLINCMVHIRRHFEQALDENRPMAEHGIMEIQHLYKIEHMCDDASLTPDERKAKRQELARPIMEAMKLWMETEGVKYSESSLIGKAITYAYTRWDNMMRYLEDGRLLLDKGGVRDVDNIVEGTILRRMRYVLSRWAGRTTTSAGTTKQHRIWQSSAHYWLHAETMMLIRGITSMTLSARCHTTQRHRMRNSCNYYHTSGN